MVDHFSIIEIDVKVDQFLIGVDKISQRLRLLPTFTAAQAA